MAPPSIGVFIICIAMASSIQLRDPSFRSFQTNETELSNGKLKCNEWEPTLGSLLDKEIIWIANMKNHLGHINFFIDIFKRDYEYLLNVTTETQLQEDGIKIDKKTYLGNPFSLFALLKRSARYWPKVVNLMYSLPGGMNSMGLHNSSLARLKYGYELHLPNIENLNTGYRGLSRLQRVYDLTTDSLAEQKMTSQESLLSASDFLGFANYFCTEGVFDRCQEWADKAQEKITSSLFNDAPRGDSLEFSFISNCLNGNQASANINLQDLLERKSTFSALINLRERLDTVFKNGCKHIIEEIADYEQKSSKILNEQSSELENSRHIAWRNVYDRDPRLLELCKYPAVYKLTARLLRCRYVHYNKPHLRIGPFKMEEFHIDPPILMFHDVISDKEISEMLKYGWSIMSKATVHNADGTETVDVNYRTNEQGWVPDHWLPIVQVLNQRVASMTGLSLQQAEPTQVSCYGPGGEFLPHVDALSEASKALIPEFADYSVIMFYINDVVAGGHTIFPALNVSLVPRKGSAVLWFNRKPDGSTDHQSMHGGCPVLKGYKWVINKWLHTQPQDFPKCTNKENLSYRYFYL